jgi:hypothetical protein
MNHRLRRVLVALGIAILSFEALYLIAANAILQTRSLDRWVTGATPDLMLKVGSGWTLLPGRVHVEDVELHFEDYNVQFALSVEAATVDISLWELPAKIFHLTRVRAHGASYRFRHKVSTAEGHEQRLAHYPKIASFSDPPLFVGPDLPPLSDADYNLWTIHLEDVDAYARELWFLEYRFTGRARAKGGFRLEPQRDAQTERCSLTFDGSLHVGSQTAASRLHGWLRAKLDRHDPRVVEGAQIFKKISVNTKLSASLPDLGFTEIYRERDGLELSGGKGTLHARVQLEHGAWMKNTELRYDTDSVRVARGGGRRHQPPARGPQNREGRGAAGQRVVTPAPTQ